MLAVIAFLVYETLCCFYCLTKLLTRWLQAVEGKMADNEARRVNFFVPVCFICAYMYLW